MLIEIGRSVMVEVNLSIIDYCHREYPVQRLRNARTACLLEDGTIFNRIKGHINRDLNNSTFPEAGEIVLFKYSSNQNQQDLVLSIQSFINYAIAVQTHELAFSIAYDRKSERTISTEMISTPRSDQGDKGIAIAGVTQWLSIVVEDIASEAVYKTAIGILQVAEDSEQPYSFPQNETKQVSLYDHFVRDEDRSIVDEIISQFVCFRDYKSILSLYQDTKFWHKLPDYRTILCGYKTLLEEDTGLVAVFDASVSAREDDPSHLQSLLELAQNEQIGARQEIGLGELKEAVVKQTTLINSIKEILIRGEYREEKGILMTELRRVEAQISAASDVAGPFFTALQLGVSFTNFGSAGWKMFEIISNVPTRGKQEGLPPHSHVGIPDASKNSAISTEEYLWSRRKELTAAGQALGNSLTEILSKFDTARSGMSLFDLHKEREKIMGELHRLEQQFEEILSEIRFAYSSFRKDINAIASKIGRIELRRREVDITIASNLRSIISLNLLDNLWTARAKYSLDRCKRAIEAVAENRYGASELEIASGCLGVGETFRQRRECLRDKEDGSERDVFVVAGERAVKVLNLAELTCVLQVADVETK